MSLVERVDEWALLEEVLANSTEGPSRVVVVRGPVATGKSELLNGVADQAEARGLTVLRATGLRAERRTPMAVFGQLLLNAGRAEGPRDLPERDGLARPEQGELRETSATRVEQLLDDARFTAMLRDPDYEREEHVRAHVMRSLTTALHASADGRALAILVDDVQYADIPSLQCLQHVMRELRAKPLVIVLGLRTGPRAERPMFSAELLRHPRLTQLRLVPLGERATAEMLREHLDEATARRLAPDVHRVSGGNPLLVETLLPQVLSDGLPLYGGHYVGLRNRISILSEAYAYARARRSTRVIVWPEPSAAGLPPRPTSRRPWPSGGRRDPSPSSRTDSKGETTCPSPSATPSTRSAGSGS